MVKVARFLKNYKKEVILGPMFKLAEAVLELYMPLVMADLIDVGVANHDVNYVVHRGLYMLLIAAVGLSCALVCQYYGSRASQGYGTDVRNALFRHINTLSHAEIDKIGTPSLITRITNDVNQLQYAVAMLIRLVVRAPFLCIGAIVMSMMLDLKLSVIFLVTAPLIALVVYLVMSRSIPFYRVIQKKLDRISLITRENLEGVRVIRAFSKQDSERQRFEEAAVDHTNTAIKVGKLAALLNPLTYIIMNFGIIALLWMGGLRIEVGGLSQGVIIAFINYVTQILLQVIVVANLVVTFTKAAACAQRVEEIFEMAPSVAQKDGAEKLVKIEGAPVIEFRDVWLSYHQNDEYALEGISFSVKKGQTIGIIGGTGSGKSTLINAIPRFYDVSKGTILVDGQDVRDYPLDQLRRKIGLVPQNAVLFTGSIAENIRWGNKDAGREEIRWALETAQAAEFVDSLPEGIDTHIEQGGKNVSGGQKQRLTIARALVRRPEVLILDDSSSALDFATDARLRQAIARETQGMTVIIVSQRASSIRYADKILVLDDGALVGVGTHQELYENCETYREICLSQLSAEEAKR